MGRQPRDARSQIVYHVLNRANPRMTIFEKPDDYLAIESVLQESVDKIDMRLLAYCSMPNRWQLVVWPKKDSDGCFLTACRYVERNALRATLVEQARTAPENGLRR